MIQDLGDHVFDNAYRPVKAGPDGWVLSYRGRTCLMAERGNGLVFPRVGELGLDPAGLTYLFRVDDEEFFLPARPVGAPEGFAYTKVFRLRFAEPRYRAYAAVAGLSLANWYAASRFCGRCGHATEPSPVSREKVCPSCGNVIYPRIQPAVICGVTWGDRILLTKYAAREYSHFALVAGFNEIGETLEETCHREVMEEVGLRIKNLRYYKDQPWPFTDTLLAGFYAELDGGPDIEVDHQELKLGTWVSREELPDHLEDTSSLTNEMIMHFRNGWDGGGSQLGEVSAGPSPAGVEAACPASDESAPGGGGGEDAGGSLPRSSFELGNLELEPEEPEAAVSLVRQATGETLALSLPCVIGRGSHATCRILGNDAISREHAEVFRSEGSVLVRDLGSVNRTRLDGTPLEAGDEVELKDGATLRLADEDFLVRIGG